MPRSYGLTGRRRLDACRRRRLALTPSSSGGFVERDRSAWEDVYAEYGPRLRPFAYRLTGNPHDADDLVQETFVRALPRLDRLDPDTADVAPYLFTTLRNLFLKSVERGRRTEPVADVPEPTAPAPIEDDPERSTLLHDQQEEVRVANARLCPAAAARARAARARRPELRRDRRRRRAERERRRAADLAGAREPAHGAAARAGRSGAAARGVPRASSRCSRGTSTDSSRGAQLEETLAHLESCERCQDALSSMQEAQRRYRTLLPIFGGGDELRGKIDAELTSSGYWSRPPRRYPRLHGRRALVAATVALLVAGAGGVGASIVVSDDGRKAVRVVTSVPRTRSTTSRPATTTTATTTRRRTTPTAPTITPVVPPTTTTAATTTTPAPDTTAPTVTILTHPPARTTSGNASISFRASELGVSLSCSRDGGRFTPCASPVAYRGLPPGLHSFAVRARDRAGNTGRSQTIRWKVLPPPVTPPPTTIAQPFPTSSSPP